MINVVDGSIERNLFCYL